jgi:hypothetical protein
MLRARGRIILMARSKGMRSRKGRKDERIRVQIVQTLRRPMVMISTAS